MLKTLTIVVALLGAITSLKTHQITNSELKHQAMVPGVINTIKCDGNTGKCKMQLQFGANNYWAVWDTSINTNPPQHQTIDSELTHQAMVPGMTNTIKCDGNTGKCKMQLQFGANNYWAVWDALITPSPPQ